MFYFCNIYYKNFIIFKDLFNIYNNKKSTESGVAPAGIKSHKFLFELKKIYFAVFKRLMG